MAKAEFLAFDLGAESGRGVLGIFDQNKLRLTELHRFPNGPVKIMGHLHWNIMHLYEEIKKTMSLYAREYGKQLQGIGVDTWGVDFGFVGRNNTLIGFPYAYRDKRTDGMMERAFQRMPREEIYQRTGIQFMQLNSLFQLYAMVLEKSPILEAADRLLFMPDLFNFLLTGVKVTEFTIATTSQLYDPRKKTWCEEIFNRLELPRHLMPEISPPGTIVGPLLGDIAEEPGLEKVPVIAPASHDTGSAVAAVPASGEDWAYLSSGTWSLLGLEVQEPIINEQSLAFDLTNEGGVEGTFRFLKNIMGLWLVQECRRQWEREGEGLDYEAITRLAAQARPFVAFVDPDHQSFLHPDNMPEAIIAFIEKTGQPRPSDKGELIRCVLESLALKYKLVLDKLDKICGKPTQVLHIVGGGSRNQLLCQLTANAIGRPVIAGPAEATAIGNLAVQAVTKGILSSIKDARKMIRDSFDLVTYEPQETEAWLEAYDRFAKIIE